MTKEEHSQRHIELHKFLDELVADWIDHTKSFPSKSTVFELMQWSNGQTTFPTEMADSPPYGSGNPRKRNHENP